MWFIFKEIVVGRRFIWLVWLPRYFLDPGPSFYCFGFEDKVR